MAAHTRNILLSSPVSYLHTAKVSGSLFDPEDTTGALASVFTKFYVDHEEPLAAKAEFEGEHSSWPLGDLLEGHEYLVIIPRVGGNATPETLNTK
jgi:hypothetical protein